MTRARRLGLNVFACVVLACLAGCSENSSSSPTNPTTPTLDLTGTWATNITAAGVTARMGWALTQSGTNVTGPVTVSLPTGTVLLNGVLSGTLAGTSLNYTISVPPGGIPLQPSCAGQLTGTMAATSTMMTGTMNLASSTCTVPISNQNITMTKQ